jgi:GTP-binding protein Era
MNHKAGFVNIVGKPNVGKSTLMNALVGQNLSIITAKAQTTRHRIMGIVSGKDFQIVYSDTPGILKPAYKLHKGMMDAVEGSFTDADVVIYVTEPAFGPAIEEETLVKLRKLEVPVIILINKVDTIGNDHANGLVEDFRKMLPGGLVATISALKKWNIETVFKKIIELLPESPPFYPEGEISDRSVRFFCTEIIREKILLNYEKEIPYSCEVVIDSYKEEPKIDRIAAIIYVARESQKGIVIGHKGEKLKKVGTEARKSMEEMLEKKVFLELQVKVAKDWREDDKMLRRFGYIKK